MSSAIIVIDDSSDDEAPPPRSTLTAASIAAEASAIAAAASANKRQRTDPTTGTSTSSTSTPPELPAIITPSFTGAAAASASAAATTNGASAAAATKSPRAATSAKKRPSPTLGDEARKLDHALERAAGAGASSGTSKSPEEEASVEITDPRATIVDILGSCHAKVSFGAGRGPMPAEATMGLPGLSVKGVGPVALPLLPAQAAILAAQGTLHAMAREAPLYQWLPEDVQFANPTYAPSLDRALGDACDQLRVDRDRVSVSLYKMLLHTTGDRAETLHLRGNAPDGGVGSLVLMPPAIYSGGKVSIKRKGSTVTETFDLASPNQYDWSYFSLFDSAAYDIEPLDTGSRIMLIYNIIQTDVAAAIASKAATIPPRIQYRDDAQIRREFLAATKEWDTTKTTPSANPAGSALRSQRQIILMLENQYSSASTQAGKTPAKSHFRSNDRKIVELVQECIREGANVDWCVGKVVYKLSGRGKNNPDRSTSAAAPEYVFDRFTREALEINLGSRFGTVSFSKHGSSGDELKREHVYPREFYEKMIPNDTFDRRYSYYDDESRIEATRKYASRSCLFIWPRGQTYRSTFEQADCEGAKEMVTYVNDSSRSRFTGAIQLQNNQKLMDDFVKTVYSHDMRPYISDVTAQIIRFDATDAATSFIGSLCNYSSSRDEMREKALPLLFQHFDASVFVDKLASLVKTTYLESLAKFVLQILSVECKGMSANLRVHPCKNLLFVLSKRVYDKGYSSESHRVSGLAKPLGCRESEYGYYNENDHWPKHSVSDILVKLCENYHVLEEVESQSSDANTGASGDNPAPKSPFHLFIVGVVGALSWNKITSASTLNRIQEKFSNNDLRRVGTTLALTEAGRDLLGRCFVEGSPLEVAAELTSLVIKEAGENGSEGVGSDDVAKSSAVNLFAWPLLKDVVKLVAPSFAAALVIRMNKEGSKGRHKEMGKSLRGASGFDVGDFVSYLCANATNDSATTTEAKGTACSSDDVVNLFCSLGSAFVEQSTPQDRAMFEKLMSKSALEAVVACCGIDVLSTRIKEWQKTLALGPAAGLVLQLCELGEVSSGADAAAASSSSSKASEASILSKQFLDSFAERVIGSNQISLTESLSMQKSRSSSASAHSDETAKSVWPANSIGKVIRYLCENSEASTASSSSSNKKGAGEMNGTMRKFLSATFKALARDQSTATIKSESGAKNSTKRLLCANDVAFAVKQIGLEGLSQILMDMVVSLPFASSADLLASFQSGDRRAKSSAASLGLIVDDALKLTPDIEAGGLKVQLLLSFVQKRVMGNGRAHFVSLTTNLQRHQALTREVLGLLCREGPSSATIKSQDITGFLSAICSAVTNGLPFHENTFLAEDFSSAIAKVGDFNVISGLFSPVVTALTTSGRSSDAMCLLHLLLSNAPSETALNACATLNLGRIVLKILDTTTNSAGQMGIENQALAMLLFWISHLEGTNPAILRASMAAARAPRPLEAAYSAALVCSTQLVTRLFKLKLQDTSRFLAEADTLLSSSAAESKVVASVRASALLEQVANRAVTNAEKEMTSGPPKPTESYNVVSSTDDLGIWGASYRSFLKDPCDTAHRSKCPQSNHTKIRHNLRPLIRRGDISVSFSQSYKGAPYYIRIAKLKKKPLPSSGVVPRCQCGRVSCELNIYQKGNYTGGREITQHFVDGLKDSRSILSLRAKGKRPAPEVEFVPNKPKPVAEVVDLLE